MAGRCASMADQRVTIVARQFESQLAHYTSGQRGAGQSRAIEYLRLRDGRELRAQDGAALRICEFGGADGLLLARLREHLGGDLDLVNAEITEAFADRQADPTIRFVATSLLEPVFEPATFDVVVARHVLHHLVADNFESTRRNQALAFAQLCRVTRPGGLVLVEEHVNPSRSACRILYELSRLATKARLSIPSFEVTPHTVVAFLTPRELADAASRGSSGALEIVAREFLPVPMPLQWRLTMLRRNSGNLFVACRVRTG